MNLYTYLSRMEDSARAALLDSNSWGVQHLREIGIRQAGEMPELCPARIGSRIFEDDDRTCEAIAPTAGQCRACRARYLEMEVKVR